MVYGLLVKTGYTFENKTILFIFHKKCDQFLPVPCKLVVLRNGALASNWSLLLSLITIKPKILANLGFKGSTLL